MEELIRALLNAGSAPLASEEAACAAVVAVRFPDGILCHRCGRTCRRVQAQVTCDREKKPHRFTILRGTPFGTKTKPCVRALLLAMHAMSSTHASTSARALARSLRLKDHTTTWRHVQTLRTLVPLPPAPMLRTKVCGVRPYDVVVQVTGRNGGAHNGWVRVGTLRIAGESTRTWLNGTFHGVSARWLARYVAEHASRTLAAADWLRELVPRFLDGLPLVFRVVRPPSLDVPAALA